MHPSGPCVHVIQIQFSYNGKRDLICQTVCPSESDHMVKMKNYPVVTIL